MLDTGSSWSGFATTDCTDCTTDGYDYSVSSSYLEIVDSAMTWSFNRTTYGTVDGVQATDTVCLTADSATCLTDFEWMNIQTSGLDDDINGVLGLSADPT